MLACVALSKQHGPRKEWKAIHTAGVGAGKARLCWSLHHEKYSIGGHGDVKHFQPDLPFGVIRIT